MCFNANAPLQESETLHLALRDGQRAEALCVLRRCRLLVLLLSRRLLVLAAWLLCSVLWHLLGWLCAIALAIVALLRGRRLRRLRS